MQVKRRPGRPTKAEDADTEKIRMHLLAHSLGYIKRMETIADKLFKTGINNPEDNSKELKSSAEIYFKLADIAGLKPKEPLIQVNDNRQVLNVPGTPEYFLARAQEAQAKKTLASPATQLEPAMNGPAFSPGALQSECSDTESICSDQ